MVIYIYIRIYIGSGVVIVIVAAAPPAAAAAADADADADAASAAALLPLVLWQSRHLLVIGKSNLISAIAEPASMPKVFIACQEASSGRRTATLSLRWRYQRKRV